MRVVLPLALLLTVAACDGPPAAAPTAAPAAPASSSPTPAPPLPPAAVSEVAPPPATQPSPKIVLLDAGAAPRSARSYAFVKGRTDKRIVTVRQSAAREGEQAREAAAYALTVELTPRAVELAGAKMELRVVKITVPDAKGAERMKAEAQLAPLVGITGAFDISPRGEVGAADFTLDEKLAGPGSEVFAQSLQQALDLVDRDRLRQTLRLLRRALLGRDIARDEPLLAEKPVPAAHARQHARGTRGADAGGGLTLRRHARLTHGDHKFRDVSFGDRDDLADSSCLQVREVARQIATVGGHRVDRPPPLERDVPQVAFDLAHERCRGAPVVTRTAR